MFLIASWTQESFSNKIHFWGVRCGDCHEQNRIPLSAIFQFSCYSPDSGEGISKLFGVMDPLGI